MLTATTSNYQYFELDATPRVTDPYQKQHLPKLETKDLKNDYNKN